MNTFFLPDPIWELVFFSLPVVSILKLSQTCKAWKSIAESASLWKRIAFKLDVVRQISIDGIQYSFFPKLIISWI